MHSAVLPGSCPAGRVSSKVLPHSPFRLETLQSSLLPQGLKLPVFDFRHLLGLAAEAARNFQAAPRQQALLQGGVRDERHAQLPASVHRLVAFGASVQQAVLHLWRQRSEAASAWLLHCGKDCTGSRWGHAAAPCIVMLTGENRHGDRAVSMCQELALCKPPQRTAAAARKLALCAERAPGWRRGECRAWPAGRASPPPAPRCSCTPPPPAPGAQRGGKCQVLNLGTA